MRPDRIFTAVLCIACLLGGCDRRADITTADCTVLATKKLSEAEQIKLGKDCAHAGSKFKRSPARQW